jgi:hypothetical protein
VLLALVRDAEVAAESRVVVPDFAALLDEVFFPFGMLRAPVE